MNIYFLEETFIRLHLHKDPIGRSLSMSHTEFYMGIQKHFLLHLLSLLKTQRPKHAHVSYYFPFVPLIKKKYLLVLEKTNLIGRKRNKQIRVGNSIMIKCLNAKITL